METTAIVAFLTPASLSITNIYQMGSRIYLMWRLSAITYPRVPEISEELNQRIFLPPVQTISKIRPYFKPFPFIFPHILNYFPSYFPIFKTISPYLKLFPFIFLLLSNYFPFHTGSKSINHRPICSANHKPIPIQDTPLEPSNLMHVLNLISITITRRMSCIPRQRKAAGYNHKTRDYYL